MVTDGVHLSREGKSDESIRSRASRGCLLVIPFWSGMYYNTAVVEIEGFEVDIKSNNKWRKGVFQRASCRNLHRLCFQ